jgi:hypothetical protein
MSSRNPTSPSISRTASPKPFSEYCNGRCGNAVETSARAWSCGTEGRLMYENLCEHEDWQERLMDLAPNLEIDHPADMAAAILTNYFDRAIHEDSRRDMENDERRWAKITDPEPISGSESI